ncbi:prolyl oligopeptidase family serine peptidase [Phytoactinopolyspora endophytica]|uniref:prolyl oligopeptidase family serine peptidase n=1 Tax=Phytoactinopolyspora endophytica TaxID=1642495 RepID=UPI00101E13E4|nr:prolyl oligopeptidase family serine peptidase [Phytoactinopolyspora endophytica]
MTHDSPTSPYPSAPKGDDADVLHGVTAPDPFRALEDPDSDETRTWRDAQDTLVERHRERWTSRETFRQRLTELLRSGSVGAPVWRGERSFHSRRTADQEHAVLLTTDPDGTERALIDPMAIDPTGTTTLDTWQPSKEGDLLAYQLSEGGREESVVRVLDVSTGEVVDGPIDRARYSPVAWLPGGKAYYYVRRLAPDLVPEGEEQYHRRVFLHRLGTDPSTDVQIFGDGKDKSSFYGVSVSRDGRWLIVSVRQGTAPRHDIWMADLNDADPATPDLRPVMVGLDALAELHVGRDGRLYVLTNLDAPRGRLAVADPTTPAPEHWQDLLPEDPTAVLEDCAILDGPELDRPVLLATWTRHAISEITVHELDTGRHVHTLTLPGLGSVGGLIERPEGGHEAWFGYTDHSTPSCVLRYDARTNTIGTWATSPGAVELPRIRSEQVTYRSKDGTEVRMIILSPAESDGHAEAESGDVQAPSVPRPTVLYGYGGFNISLTPAYSASTLAWVEAGGVWAVANLRGGSEEGEEWHRAGMRANKQNVFDDFHAAAEYLIEQGWTTPGMLGISGGSNGGLLVGASLTQHPETFRAVACSAPLLDMVRYELSGLGALWTDEYGTVAEPEEFHWLLGYSPYHHVKPGTEYPAVLFTVFDGDTRVDPMHARKLAAALQDATAADPDRRPILIRAEREVGHGARAVSRTVDLAADQLSFLAAQLVPPTNDYADHS